MIATPAVTAISAALADALRRGCMHREEIRHCMKVIDMMGADIEQLELRHEREVVEAFDLGYRVRASEERRRRSCVRRNIKRVQRYDA